VTDLDPTQPDGSALEPASLAMFSSPPLRSDADAQDAELQMVSQHESSNEASYVSGF